MRTVCVFCGSQSGSNPAYAAAARELGRELARRGLGLVYGGGRVGLMGEVASAVLGCGGEVVGVIPHALSAKEIALAEATEPVGANTIVHGSAAVAASASYFVCRLVAMYGSNPRCSSPATAVALK